MSSGRQRVGLGRQGEELAVQELQRRGYEIVARNWRCALGEADIIARRGPVWAFVEVRTRRGATFGLPEESITPRKRARMMAVAERYIAEHGLWEAEGRLMVVAVVMDRAGHLQRLEVLEVEG
ncbi:MAG: YraN family protein [Anaerolineae bacterium]|nr:YraN family protein [Anaerolineae bacterium]MDW8068627.1 YraN family protein [Anaerolineae bacterium]